MWNDLVNKNSLKYSNEEIEKIKNISEILHQENEQLRLEVDSLRTGRELLLEKIKENEKVKQQIQKDLQRVSNNLKFEIKAREGMSKKTNLYEYEALTLREECQNQREELGILRYKVKDLEYRLNQERSKRLRDLHETDILRKRNIELESLGSHAEKDALLARQNLSDKLERLEVIMQQNESQKRIISSMSGEILALNGEVTSLKEDLKRALEGKYQHENTISTKTRETEHLEREVSRLRREVALGLNLSQRGSLASLSIEEEDLSFQGFHQSQGGDERTFQTNSLLSRRGNDVISSTSTPFSTTLLNQKYSSTSSNSSPQSRPTTQLSRSLNSTSETFQPSELQGKRFNRQPFAHFTTSSPTSSIQLNSQYLNGQTSPTERQKEEKSLSHVDAISIGPKSRYTGSGLGLRRSEIPEFNPKGSAKSVLKKILKEQQEKEKN